MATIKMITLLAPKNLFLVFPFIPFPLATTDLCNVCLIRLPYRKAAAFFHSMLHYCSIPRVFSRSGGGGEEKPTDIDCRLVVVHPSLPFLWLEVVAELNEPERMRFISFSWTGDPNRMLQSVVCRNWMVNPHSMSLVYLHHDDCRSETCLVCPLKEQEEERSRRRKVSKNGKSMDGRNTKFFFLCILKD